MKKIDIIIPVFKAKETLVRALSSISTQLIVDKCKVPLVNDGDGLDYSDIINSFSQFMEIVYIKLETNCGPAVARQVGIDNSNLPYFACLDADDAFANPFALWILLDRMEKEKNVSVVVGTILEEKEKFTFIQKSKDLTFMGGKLYRRSFIEKFNIRFMEIRSKEDAGFNTIVKLCANENDIIAYSSDITYYWLYRQDSITRNNNGEFTYKESFVSYTDNMIYAINHAKKVNPNNSFIDTVIVQVFAELYVFLMRTKVQGNQYLKQNFNACVKYYNEIYSKFDKRYSKESVENIISQKLVERSISLMGIIPFISIYEFIEKLKEGVL